jgi:hypothetical protein
MKKMEDYFDFGIVVHRNLYMRLAVFLLMAGDWVSLKGLSILVNGADLTTGK